MLIKITQLFKIILIGAMFFSALPLASYASSPYVTTGNATGITNNGVTLNGSVNAESMPTGVWFEYGAYYNLSNSTSISASRSNYPFPNGNLIATVSGLYPNTTYYFRAVAQNYEGRSYGNIYSFTTASYPLLNYNYGTVNASLTPTAITEPASSISSESVQLNSLILNAEDNSSNAWFEWGNTANLGSKTVVISAGSLPAIRHADILTGLSPGTTYYFRAVSENSFWRNNGLVLSFVTRGVKPSVNTGANTPAITNSDITNKTNTEVTTPTTLEKETKVQPESSLEANVIESNSFFPTNIIGWIILLILILILILLSKNLYYNFLNKKPEYTQKHP